MEASEMLLHLQKSDMFAMLIGAMCHDVDHRGYNTAFEVATRSELAIRYNDLSPLENHHCSLAFQLAFSENGKCDIFKDMNSDFYAPMRKTMVQAILGTDMKFHGEHVKKASKFQPSEGDQADIGEKGPFLVELLMHAADIANPYMPPDLSQKWSLVLAEEFTLQVKAERELGIPVTPFMDGLTTDVARAKSGAGFSNFVVSPLMNPLFKLYDGYAPLKEWLAENKKALQDVIDKDEAAKNA